MNNSLVFEKAPERIVSLVPSQTELLVDLRLRENIQGITKFCVHPTTLKDQKTIVGGTKQVSYDKIKSLRPDIILCNKEENTKDMVAALRKIAPVHISDITSIEDNLELIRQYGTLFNRASESRMLSDTITERYLRFNEGLEKNRKLRVGYFIWRQPYMVAGEDTFIHTMLEVCNFENVFASSEGRYPEVLLGQFPEMDLLMLSSEPYPFLRKHIKEIQAYTQAEIALVDGEYFSWYGSRILKAFDYFESLLKTIKI